MLIKRVLSALVGVPLVLFFIYLGDLWYAILIWLIMLLGLREFFHMTRVGSMVPEILGYVGATALLAAVFGGDLSLILTVITAVFVVTAAMLVIRFKKAHTGESFAVLWGILYVGGLFSYLVLIRNTFDYEFTVILLAAAWLNDTFAYFTGNKWGRRKLIPAVSPGKTVEGSLGGLLGTVLLIAVTHFLLEFFYPLNLGLTLALTVFIVIIAQFGDLVESALKRKFNTKDSGSLIPGHGGILDRFDSIMFAAPFVYYFLILLV